MSRNRFFPTCVFTLAILVTCLVGAAQAATPADKIIDEWFQGLRDAGARVAKYDAIRIDEATNTATIENIQIDWQIDFGAGSVDIMTSAGEVVIVGLEQEADGYGLKQYSISDDFRMVFSGKDGEGKSMLMSGTAIGARAEGMFFPKFTTAPQDPNRPVSRFLHYYDLFAKTVVDRSSVDKMVIEHTSDTDLAFQAEYQGVVTLGMRDGRVAESRVASYKQTSVFPKPPQTGTDQAQTPEAMPLDTMVTTYGAMVARGLDFRALVEGLTGQGTSPDYRVFSEETTVSDINVSVGPVSVAVGGYRVAGMKIRPGSGSVLDMFDRMALGQEQDPKQAMRFAHEIFQRFALDELSIDEISGSGPENVAARLDKFLIGGLSADGLGTFEIGGIDINGSGAEKVSLERILFGKVLFPSFEAILAAIENGPPQDPIAMANLAPKVGQYEVAKLFVDTKKSPPVSVGFVQALQSAYVGPIPTDIRIQVRDLNFPVDFIQDVNIKTMLQSLGYSVLTITSDLVLTWDEATRDLTLANAFFELANGGRISLTAGFAGFPRSVIENPASFEQALATLAFKNVNVLVRDATLVSGLVEQFAAAQQKTPEDLRNGLIAGLVAQAGPLAGTPFIEQAKLALAAFMVNPERLSIDFAPSAPIPFTQILGTAATTPAAMPALLGAGISAN